MSKKKSKKELKSAELKAVETVARNLTLATPGLYKALGTSSGPTSSGEDMSVPIALKLDTVWACVRLIAGTIATLPLPIYQRQPGGYAVEAPDHPLYPVLHDQPNADMTAVTFWTSLIANYLLWGNGYAAIEPRGDGQVAALTPMLPNMLTVTRQSDGSLLYRYNYYGITLELTEDQVFHIKGFSLDGMTGLSPIGQAREQLGIAAAAERAAGSVFRNGMRPSMVMSAPAYLTPKQREEFDDTYRAKFRGAINTGNVPLLEGGWKLDTIGMNPVDAELLATRVFSIEQICRWYGVNPIMVGHTSKSTAWGTGLEQMNLWFLAYTLRPILRTIEQEIRRSLLKAADRKLYYAEHNVEGLLRTDSAGRAAYMRNLVDGGINTSNEMRAVDNWPPADGGDYLTTGSGRQRLVDLGKAPALLARPPGGPSSPIPPANDPTAEIVVPRPARATAAQ